MAKINPLVALAIPTWGKVSINWARAYKHVGGPLGANVVELAPVVGMEIAAARNQLMKDAIDNHCDFILFLGDDVLMPADTMHRMLIRMWERPEINLVTGMYWTKQWPTQPYIWRDIQRGPYMDWRHGEFFEVDYSGIDCLMIRLSDEMKALGPEWFSTEWRWENEGEPHPILLATEDFYFFTKTRKAGMKLWCDSNIQCIHEDRNTGTQFALTTDMPQYSGKDVALPEAGTDVAPLVKIADIGAGQDGPFFGHADRVKLVRFDGNEKAQPDFRCDIRHLPVPDQSFDAVHSRHVLEHFGRGEVMKVLKEWTRILRVGGEFRMAVPNLMHALRKVFLMEEGAIEPHPYAFWQLYGRQDDEYDIHKNGFTPKRVELLLKRLGIFEDIVVTVSGDENDDDVNIHATARKVKHLTTHALLPEWDEIEKAEGMQMAGLSDREPVAVGHESSGASWVENSDAAQKVTQETLRERDPVGYAARNGAH